MERTNFTASDGKTLSVAVWKSERPRAVALIVHGMAEHIARYDEFASFLASRGVTAFGPDLRAHGLTDPDALGLSRGTDLFNDSVRDISELVAAAKGSGLPVVVIGHSYGSFLCQGYLASGGSGAAAVILSGSALQKGAAVSLGARMAASKSKKHEDEPGETFAAMTFGRYNKRFDDGLGGWLNRDIAAVGRYNADPYCGFTCSNGFYKSFFAGLKNLAKSNHVPLGSGVKILLISGSEDPVGGRGKLVKKLYKRYLALGCDVRLELVPGARHEVFNEIDRASSYAVVADFIDKAIDKS